MGSLTRVLGTRQCGFFYVMFRQIKADADEETPAATPPPKSLGGREAPPDAPQRNHETSKDLLSPKVSHSSNTRAIYAPTQFDMYVPFGHCDRYVSRVPSKRKAWTSRDLRSTGSTSRTCCRDNPVRDRRRLIGRRRRHGPAARTSYCCGIKHQYATTRKANRSVEKKTDRTATPTSSCFQRSYTEYCLPARMTQLSVKLNDISCGESCEFSTMNTAP